MFTSDLPPWPRYRPIRVIGQGGFGTVYLCEDTEPTSAMYMQEVAVKAISLTALSDEEALMVMSEVSLLKNMDHPNIIKYYDSFLYEEEEGQQGDTNASSSAPWPDQNNASTVENETRGAAAPGVVAQWLCLVTEYMDGGDLSSLLREYTHPTKKTQKDNNNNGATEEESETLVSLQSATGEMNKLRAVLHTPSLQLLEGPYSEEMFEWDSSSDTDAADTSSQLFFQDHHGHHPFSKVTATAKAAVTAEMPLSGQQYKRCRSVEANRRGARSNKEEKNGKVHTSTGGKREEGADDWERRSRQHRQRLASTLRLATHPFQSNNGEFSTGTDNTATALTPVPAIAQTWTTLATTWASTTAKKQDKAADQGVPDTWISDASVAVIPATPLGATQLAEFPQFDQTDTSNASPFKTHAGGSKEATTLESGDKIDGAAYGESSASQLEPQLPPSPDQLWVESFLITDIAKQCLDALAYLHALGIVHRDIKPSNIYLSKRDGTVKIGDFGVSKLLQPSAPFTTTFVGTPFYLCPELCMGDPYSYGADVWALGVLLYELYCLKLPFTADNVLGQIYVITEGKYDKTALRRPHAFAEAQRSVLESLYGPSFAQSEVLLRGLVVELVEQMLSVDPAQRPSAEILLARVFGSSSGSAVPSRVGSSAGNTFLLPIAPTPVRRPPSAGLLPFPFEGNISREDSAPSVSSDARTSITANNNAFSSSGSPESDVVGGGDSAVKKNQTNRLGLLAADQHARWAGSLVQAASAALNNSSSTSRGYDYAVSAESTPAPPSRLWSSPQLTPTTASNITNNASSHNDNGYRASTTEEPLAIKVKLNMLDILQGMPCEQRERLESRAAEEDAYDAQRLRSAVGLSSLSAAVSAAKPTKVEQMQLSFAYDSFGYHKQLQLLQPVFQPSNQLYNTSSPQRETQEQQDLFSAYPIADFMKRADVAVKNDVNCVIPTAPLVTSLSTKGREEEDSFDRLIGASTRDELSAFLEEVPWLQNADVFSAIPLSAGSDDVMLVARVSNKNHQQQRNNSCSSYSSGAALDTVQDGSEVGERLLPNGRGNSGSGTTNTPGSSTEGNQSQHTNALSVNGKSEYPPAPAVRYASSVSRTNPNIEVSVMPQRYQQRRRRANISGSGSVGLNRIAPAKEDASSLQQQNEGTLERELHDEEKEQRRVSRGSTFTSPDSFASSSSTSVSFAASHHTLLFTPADGNPSSNNSSNPNENKRMRKASGARGQRGSAAIVAATATIVASSLVAEAGDRTDSSTLSMQGGSNGECPEASTMKEGNAMDDERGTEEEAPATVSVITGRGGSSVLQSCLSSTRLLREGGAAGARLRPVSAKQQGGCTAASIPTSIITADLKGIFFVQSENSEGDLAKADTASSAENVSNREGLAESLVEPLSTQLNSPPTPLKQQQQSEQPEILPAPTPKVHTAGRCEGFSTSELERLLRAKLLAHYNKRQQVLKTQRAELAAQEESRAKVREKLSAFFASAYNAWAGSGSPNSVRETASYHSTHTYDTLLSTDEDSFTLNDKSHSLARVATLPPVPGTSAAASATDTPTTSLLPSRPSPPSAQQQQHQTRLQLPSARTPSSSAVTRAASVMKAASSISYGSPDALSLDQTARQAVKEEEVLRALSARHSSGKVVSPGGLQTVANNNSWLNETTPSDVSATETLVKETMTPPPVTIITSNTNTSATPNRLQEPNLLMETPAIRQLRQAASLAAAVELQKAAFRDGGAGTPSRIIVAPPWRPPHDSADVPGLWETSSAEEEAEADARGRPGRPEPAHLREELRWRWSAPPTDTDDADSSSDDHNDDEESTTTSSVTPSPSESSWQGKAPTPWLPTGEKRKAAVYAAHTKGVKGAKLTPDVVSRRGKSEDAEEKPEAENDDCGDAQLLRQSSLFGSPIDLRSKEHTKHGFPDQPMSEKEKDNKDNMQSPPSEHNGRHLSDTSSEGNGDSRSNGTNSGTDSTNSINDSNNEVAHHRLGRAARQLSRGKGIREAKKINNSRTTYSISISSTSTSRSSSIHSTSSSNRSRNDSSDSQEDMSYTYVAQIDTETGCRYFDYICPVTVELVGELPATCRVATPAQIMTALQTLTPRGTNRMFAYSPTVLTDLVLTSPSPPPRESAAAAPSPNERGEKEVVEEVKEVAEGDEKKNRPSPSPAVMKATTKGPEEHGGDDHNDELHDSIETSSNSSLFEDYLLLLPDSPMPATSVAQIGNESRAKSPNATQNVEVPPQVKTEEEATGATTKTTDSRPGSTSVDTTQLIALDATVSPSTSFHRSASYAGDNARSTPLKAIWKNTEGRGDHGSNNPASQRQVDSVFIVGTKVPASAASVTSSVFLRQSKPTAEGTQDTTPATIAKRKLSKENKSAPKSDRKAFAKHHRKSSLSAVLESAVNCSCAAWRVRVPPPRQTSSASFPAIAAATGSCQYIHLPLSLALRPIRARTRFVGLLWRLWMATQLADPALRRVILGSERCGEENGICTFAEAFGDWVRNRGVNQPSGTATLSATTQPTDNAETNVANAEAANSASASLTTVAGVPTPKLKAIQRISSELELQAAQLDLSAEREGAGGCSSCPNNISMVDVASSPRSLWSLYYVEPRLDVAVRLHSDADWEVVRLKVREMGQLLPFIRLYLVLHDAEFASFR